MTRLHARVPLRWSDFDAYAHVNNAAMLRILEEARIQAFWPRDDEDTDDDTTGVAIMDSRPGAEFNMVIAKQTIEYLVSVPYLRAALDVEMWIGRMGGASLEIEYEVYSPEGTSPRTLFTRAATTIVMVTAATGRPARIHPDQRAAWTPYVE